MSESLSGIMAYNQRCNAAPREPEVDQVPSKWMAIVVGYGEGKKHLVVTDESHPYLFPTEAEAEKWAKRHCELYQSSIVAVLRVDRLIKAAAVTFEIIAS